MVPLFEKANFGDLLKEIHNLPSEAKRNVNENAIRMGKDTNGILYLFRTIEALAGTGVIEAGTALIEEGAIISASGLGAEYGLPLMLFGGLLDLGGFVLVGDATGAINLLDLVPAQEK